MMRSKVDGRKVKILTVDNKIAFVSDGYHITKVHLERLAIHYTTDEGNITAAEMKEMTVHPATYPLRKALYSTEASRRVETISTPRRRRRNTEREEEKNLKPGSMMDSGCSNTMVPPSWQDHLKGTAGEEKDDEQCVTVKSNKSRGIIKHTHTHPAARPRETPRHAMRDLDAIEDIINGEARMMVSNIMGRIRQLENQQQGEGDQPGIVQFEEGQDQGWDYQERGRRSEARGGEGTSQTFQDQQGQSQQLGTGWSLSEVDRAPGGDGTGQSLQDQQELLRQFGAGVPVGRPNTCTHGHHGLRGKEDLKKMECPLCSGRK